jgi:hypothetical protein
VPRSCRSLPLTPSFASAMPGAVLWFGLALALTSASVAMAGIGSQISPSIAIDSANPQLAVDPLGEHATFFTDQIVSFHWTSFDHNPGTTTDHFQASIIIDSSAVETISWYLNVTDFTWNYTMPAIQSGDCRLEVVAVDSYGNTTTQSTGNFTILLSTTEVPDAPANLSLGPAAPNPFNPSTTLYFSTPEGSQATLSVYDARGRYVRHLAGAIHGSQMVAARWDGMDDGGRPQPGGVYVFVLDAQTPDGPRRLTRKAMLVP